MSDEGTAGKDTPGGSGQLPALPPPPPAKQPLGFPPPPPPAAGVIGVGAATLRPMGVGEILNASITLYRRNWRPFMGVVAAVYVPFEFLVQIVSRLVSDPVPVRGSVQVSPQYETTAVVVVTLLLAVSFLLVQQLATGAMVKAVAHAYIGQRPTVGGAYTYALGVIWSLLLVALLQALVVCVGFVLLIIPGIIFALRLIFATNALVVEGMRGRAALRRSWRLSRGSSWRILGTMLLAWLPWIVLGIITLPLDLAASATTAGWILRAIVNSIGDVLAVPFSTTVVVLLYFDTRVRKEGFNLSAMADEIGRESGGGPA